MNGSALADGPPLILCVAPNGARKTRADHPAIPITPDEMAEEAANCRDAGAAMLHLHVRDGHDRHLLDADAYRASIAAIRQRIGDDLIIQITTEAVGQYQPADQIAVVKAVKPEAVSLAIKEIIPGAASELPAEAFLHWAARERILVQYILYSADDVRRFATLCQRGVIPGDAQSVLFVLGRYTAGQTSDPTQLLDFLQAAKGQPWHWSVCAFGAKEAAVAQAAACLGGHARIGFENNLHLADGALAPNNAALVNQAARGGHIIGRPLANAAKARELFNNRAAAILPDLL